MVVTKGFTNATGKNSTSKNQNPVLLLVGSNKKGKKKKISESQTKARIYELMSYTIMQMIMIITKACNHVESCYKEHILLMNKEYLGVKEKSNNHPR